MAAWVLGTGLGAGLFPFAPGTVGSLWGPAMMYGVQAWSLPWWGMTLLALAVVLIGVPICDRCAKLLDRKDPGSVVYDEIAAFFVVFAVVPVNLATAALGYLWFRIFDITKPWPVRRLELLPGGIGIMADDLAAAVFAAVALWICIQVLPGIV